MSLNESYETYNFRQAGGYADGTFKELSEEQVEKISVHPGIREAGERTVCGSVSYKHLDVYKRQVTSIKDVTPVPHNGDRPPKRRIV